MLEKVAETSDSIGIIVDEDDTINVYYRNIEYGSQYKLQALQEGIQTYAYNYTTTQRYCSLPTKISRGRHEKEINLILPLFFNVMTLMPATRMIHNTQLDKGHLLRYGVVFSHFIFWFIYHGLDICIHSILSTGLMELISFRLTNVQFAFALQALHSLSILSIAMCLSNFFSHKISLILTYAFVCIGSIVNFSWFQYWYPHSILGNILKNDVIEDIYDWYNLIWYAIPISFAPCMLLLSAMNYYIYTYKIARGTKFYKADIDGHALKLEHFSYRVLTDINITVPYGQITFVVGPNGCGKTTLLNQMAFPKMVENYHCTSDKIGWCPQGDIFHNDWTVSDNLIYWGLYYGAQLKTLRRRIITLTREFNIPATAPAYALSGGQRRKLSLAISIIHDPDILILDEPFTNIDDESCQFICNKLVDLKNRGRAILTTSHKLYPCVDELIFLSEAGTILKRSKRVHLNLTRVCVCGGPALLDELMIKLDIQPHHIINRLHIYYVPPAEACEPSLVWKIRFLIECAGNQLEVSTREYNLEDYYFDTVMGVDATQKAQPNKKYIALPYMADRSTKRGIIGGAMTEVVLSYRRVLWPMAVILGLLLYYQYALATYSFEALIDHPSPNPHDVFLYDVPAMRPLLANNSQFIEVSNLSTATIERLSYGGNVRGGFVYCGPDVEIVGFGWVPPSASMQYLLELLNKFQTGITSKIEFHRVVATSNMWRKWARQRYTTFIQFFCLFIPIIPLFNSGMSRRFNFMRSQMGCGTIKFWTIKWAIDFVFLSPSLVIMVEESEVIYAQYILYLATMLPMIYVLSARPRLYFLLAIIFSICMGYVYFVDWTEIKNVLIYDFVMGTLFPPYAMSRAWEEYLHIQRTQAVTADPVKDYNFLSIICLVTSGSMILSYIFYSIILLDGPSFGGRQNLGPVVDGVTVVNLKPRRNFKINLSYFFKPKTIYSLVGINGSGKSSFLRVLGKVMSPVRGNAAISSPTGLKLKWIRLTHGKFHRELIYLPQSLGYIDGQQTVKDLIGMAHAYCGYKLNSTLMKYLGLDKFAKTPFRCCSGGTKQKVAFAMMYYIPGRLMLMDEPTAGLDVCSSKKVLNVINYLTDLYKRTTLIVAHEGGDSWQIAHKFVKVGSTLEDATTKIPLNA